MKKIAIFLLFFGFSIKLNGQIQTPKPSKCKHCESELKSKYFQKYYSEIQKICINNKEYFGENLDNILKPKNSQAHTINLKFDALGAIYPEIVFPEGVRKYFEKRKGLMSIKSNRYLYRNTFYQLPKKEKEFFLNTQPDSLIKKTDYPFLEPPKGSIPSSVQLDFTKDWNNQFLNNQIVSLNKKILNEKISHLLFIVHGYNVPYSLAQIQANAIIDKAYEVDIDKANKTLFIKVFWPSTSRKKVVIDDKSFIVKNKINFYSISAFRSIATRSYLVGHSLRTVLNGITNFDGNVSFFSHSLGAQVTTSTFIIPDKSLFKKDTILFKYLSNNRLHQNEFKEVKLFLNAPAMPGVLSFPKNSMDDTQNTRWIIGFNPTDKVLRKTIAFIRFGDHNGNTRLGGNWENETWELKDYISKINKKGQFEFIQTGLQYDIFGHDFFCYLNQPLFQKHFKDFITER